MFKQKLAILFIFLGLSKLSAQIVNIENLRLSNDSVRFSGVEKLNFSIVKNTRQLFTATNDLALQYRQGASQFLFLSNLAFNISANTDFERNGFFHFRYGYRQNEWITYEAFSQYQIDIPLRIQRRILFGAGLRFKLLRKEKNKLYTGHLIMQEFDKELNNDIEHKDQRLSSYLSYELRSSSHFSWNTTLYYQPRLDKPIDFRLAGQSQLQFRIIRNLRFNVTASVNYDSFPVDDPSIPDLTYKLTNGLIYQF